MLHQQNKRSNSLIQSKKIVIIPSHQPLDIMKKQLIFNLPLNSRNNYLQHNQLFCETDKYETKIQSSLIKSSRDYSEVKEYFDQIQKNLIQSNRKNYQDQIQIKTLSIQQYKFKSKKQQQQRNESKDSLNQNSQMIQNNDKGNIQQNKSFYLNNMMPCNTPKIFYKRMKNCKIAKQTLVQFDINQQLNSEQQHFLSNDQNIFNSSNRNEKVKEISDELSKSNLKDQEKMKKQNDLSLSNWLNQSQEIIYNKGDISQINEQQQRLQLSSRSYYRKKNQQKRAISANYNYKQDTSKQNNSQLKSAKDQNDIIQLNKQLNISQNNQQSIEKDNKQTILHLFKSIQQQFKDQIKQGMQNISLSPIQQMTQQQNNTIQQKQQNELKFHQINNSSDQITIQNSFIKHNLNEHFEENIQNSKYIQLKKIENNSFIHNKDCQNPDEQLDSLNQLQDDNSLINLQKKKRKEKFHLNLASLNRKNNNLFQELNDIKRDQEQQSIKELNFNEKLSIQKINEQNNKEQQNKFNNNFNYQQNLFEQEQNNLKFINNQIEQQNNKTSFQNVQLIKNTQLNQSNQNLNQDEQNVINQSNYYQFIEKFELLNPQSITREEKQLNKDTHNFCDELKETDSDVQLTIISDNDDYTSTLARKYNKSTDFLNNQNNKLINKNDSQVYIKQNSNKNIENLKIKRQKDKYNSLNEKQLSDEGQDRPQKTQELNSKRNNRVVHSVCERNKKDHFNQINTLQDKSLLDVNNEDIHSLQELKQYGFDMQNIQGYNQESSMTLQSEFRRNKVEQQECNQYDNLDIRAKQNSVLIIREKSITNREKSTSIQKQIAWDKLSEIRPFELNLEIWSLISEYLSIAELSLIRGICKQCDNLAKIIILERHRNQLQKDTLKSEFLKNKYDIQNIYKILNQKTEDIFNIFSPLNKFSTQQFQQTLSQNFQPPCLQISLECMRLFLQHNKIYQCRYPLFTIKKNILETSSSPVNLKQTYKSKQSLDKNYELLNTPSSRVNRIRTPTSSNISSFHDLDRERRMSSFSLYEDYAKVQHQRRKYYSKLFLGENLLMKSIFNDAVSQKKDFLWFVCTFDFNQIEKIKQIIKLNQKSLCSKTIMKSYGEVICKISEFLLQIVLFVDKISKEHPQVIEYVDSIRYYYSINYHIGDYLSKCNQD